jgi:hypothetical protein
MRPASILLAMVVGLCIVSESQAQTDNETLHDFTFTVAGNSFGFMDGLDHLMYATTWSTICLGPLGTYNSPLTAIQGLVGFCLIVMTLIALLVVATVRWKKKHPRQP